MPLSRLRALADSHAVKIFTDREGYKDSFDYWFECHVNGQEQLKVLVYYGVGGIGKSSLLNELTLRAKQRNKYVRIVELDFDSNHINSAADALAMFRRQWAGKCPLFDFALGRFWQASGRSIESIRQHAVPQDGLLYELANHAAMIATGGFFSLDVFKAVANKEEALRARFSKLKEPLEELETMPASELALKLPLLLGDAIREDATQRQSKTRPLLVCVDGHERLHVDGNFKLGKLLRDEWLKELIGCAELGFYVVCGRNRIGWAANHGEWEPYIEQHLVGELDDEDADQFLQGIPITSVDIRHKVVQSAGGVPLYLDLCASIYMAKKSAGEIMKSDDFDVAQADVINRFLSCLDRDQAEAVCALSMLDSFDKRLFKVVTGALNIHIPVGAYEKFCRASYATDFSLERNEDVRAIHAIVRDHLRKDARQDELLMIARAVEADIEDELRYDMRLKAQAVKSVAPVIARLSEEDGESARLLFVRLTLELAEAGFSDEAGSVANVLMDETASPRCKAYGRLLQAFYLQRTGQLKEAKKTFEMTLHDMPQSASAEIILLCRYLLAHVNHLLGEYARAKAEYKKVTASSSTKGGFLRPMLRAGRQLADIALLEGRFRDALTAIDECSDSGPTDPLWQLECKRLKGHVYRFNWMLDTARAIYLDVLASSKDVGLAGMYGKSLVNLSETCWLLEPEAAIEWGLEAIQKNTNAGNLIEIGKAETAVGLAKVALREHTEAQDSLNRAQQIQEKVGYRSGLIFVESARCFLCFSEGNWEEFERHELALKKLTEAMGVYRYLSFVCRSLYKKREMTGGSDHFQCLDEKKLTEMLAFVRDHLGSYRE